MYGDYRCLCTPISRVLSEHGSELHPAHRSSTSQVKHKQLSQMSHHPAAHPLLPTRTWSSAIPFLGLVLNSATPSCHFSLYARFLLRASPAPAAAAPPELLSRDVPAAGVPDLGVVLPPFSSAAPARLTPLWATLIELCEAECGKDAS